MRLRVKYKNIWIYSGEFHDRLKFSGFCAYGIAESPLTGTRPTGYARLRFHFVSS